MAIPNIKIPYITLDEKQFRTRCANLLHGMTPLEKSQAMAWSHNGHGHRLSELAKRLLVSHLTKSLKMDDDGCAQLMLEVIPSDVIKDIVQKKISPQKPTKANKQFDSYQITFQICNDVIRVLNTAR